MGSYRLGREADMDIYIEDPSLSRHHLDIRVDSSSVSVADADSRNGTAIAGRTLQPGERHVLTAEEELELGRSLLRVRPLRPSMAHGVREHDGRLEFNRPPRVNLAFRPQVSELPAPPSRRRKARLPLAASLVPLAAGLLLFVLLKSPVMLAIAGLSPLMALSSWVSDRRGGNKSFAADRAEFRQRLADAVVGLDEALTQEAQARRRESPDAPALAEAVADLSERVWERRPRDADFMSLRLGVADLPARSVVNLQEGGEEELRAEAEGALAPRRQIASVPVVVNLRDTGTLGLAGPIAAVSSLARWLTIQAAALHSPGELVILAALTPESAEDFRWLKWLPHLRPDRVGVLASPISVGRADGESLLGEIRDLVRQRRLQARSQGPEGSPPQVLLVIDEDTEVDRSLLTAALSEAAAVGVSCIWLGRSVRGLPSQTTSIAELDQSRALLTLTDVASGQAIEHVSAESLSVALAERVARQLAPVRDVAELARAGDIPKRVALLDLLDLLPPTSQALQQRWSQWRGDLRAAVGVGAEGTLELDLRAEGPHALIAGTTGSGKSELLRTFVAAAAAAIPPDRLSFLLVDYKGGAAFAPCAALPHVVDIVSDLDEHLAERALVSLNAELKRRERILAEAGAKDLLELTRRDQAGAPPVLVIAVDEFAKLRDEVPEFVDGVVDIAQRGRSLGVHMVLAAQTLRNAFTPAIRANTNLRLALRVAEESESEDMIASPLAARIPSGESSRGRAFVRTGHGELREFQAAYVSGRSDLHGDRGISVEEYAIAAIGSDEAGQRSSDADADSDLTALGQAACKAKLALGLSTPAAPWMPVLPELLDLAQLGQHDPGRPAIGLLDMPREQRQDELVLDLKGRGHAAIFGAGNSGKTTALTSVALALASSSGGMSIYALDAAGGGLSGLAGLAHCGGVVGVEETERVTRLMRMLLREVERRHRDGEAFEGSSHRTVLLLDDLGSFAQAYDRPGLDTPYQQLQQILSGGRAAGVHVVLSAARRGALPASLAAHIGQRLVLRMPSEEDMLSLGLDPKVVRGARLPAGRGFTQDNLEFQIAVPVADGARLSTETAVRSVDAGKPPSVRRVEVLPAQVERISLGPSRSLAALPIGVSDDLLEPATLDLTEMHLLVVGPYRSGRSTLLATVAGAVREAAPDAPLSLLAPRRSPLRDLELWSESAAGAETCAEAATRLLGRLEAGELGTSPGLVVIDDGGELTDARTITQLERLIRLARDTELRVVAAVETGAARGIGNGWIRELRREGHGVLLQPDLSADGDLLGVRLPRSVPVPMSPGRGFLVSRGAAELLHVAQ
jgi:S-DNA-T family DNA segregation ATPase FtsK/SpoIIIE